MSRKRLIAVVIAVVVGLVSVPALADGTVSWTGHGVTNGELNTVDCAKHDGAPYLFWVFTPGGNDSVTQATLTVNGDNYTMTQAGGGAWQATTSWYDLGTLVASVAYVGDLGQGQANLVISHGCPPQQLDWCSPGFWRANYVNWGASAWPVDPDTKYNSVISSPVASGDPSLIDVLMSPGSYFSPQQRGAGFNAVGDYLSAQAGLGGTSSNNNGNCPISQQG